MRADEALYQIGVSLAEFLEKKVSADRALEKIDHIVNEHSVSEAQILHDMLITMVHNTPGRIVSVAPETHLQEGRGDTYENHEMRFRMQDGVVEAFCQSCLIPKEA